MLRQRFPSLRRRSRHEGAALAPLLAPGGVALMAIGDILQNLLLLCATIAVSGNVKTASPKARLFWALMGLGLGLWMASQVLWTYFEVFLRHETPNPCVG